MTGLTRAWNKVHDRLPAQATRLLGVVFMVLALYAVLLGSNANARSLDTQQTIAEQLGYFGLSTLGVGVLIVCGGIDLSIGSVVGLGAVCFGLMLENPINGWELTIFSILFGLDVGMILCSLLKRLIRNPWTLLIAIALGGIAGAIVRPGLASFLGQRFSPWLARRSGIARAS